MEAIQEGDTARRQENETKEDVSTAGNRDTWRESARNGKYAIDAGKRATSWKTAEWQSGKWTKKKRAKTQ